MRPLCTALLLVAFSPNLMAQDNARLQSLFDQDQAARKSFTPSMDANAVQRFISADAERKKSTLVILRGGGLKTANDYMHAALILQHGDNSEDYRLAHSLATLAVAIDPSVPSGKWLMAASWDRLMSSYQRPQWYGTQFTFDQKNKRWSLLRKV